MADSHVVKSPDTQSDLMVTCYCGVYHFFHARHTLHTATRKSRTPSVIRTSLYRHAAIIGCAGNNAKPTFACY